MAAEFGTTTSCSVTEGDFAQTHTSLKYSTCFQLMTVKLIIKNITEKGEK